MPAWWLKGNNCCFSCLLGGKVIENILVSNYSVPKIFEKLMSKVLKSDLVDLDLCKKIEFCKTKLRKKFFS